MDTSEFGPFSDFRDFQPQHIVNKYMSDIFTYFIVSLPFFFP